MKSFIHLRKGRTPRLAHRDLGGLKDDELGRSGFYGRTAQLYRRNDPARYRPLGDYRLREVQAATLDPSDLADPRGHPLSLFQNDACRILLSRRSAAMPYFFRTVDGDEAYFIHIGTGRFETEFGPIDYEPGDWIVIPKAVTYRVVPSTSENCFLIVESALELLVPDYGMLGRHAPFDPSAVVVPEPAPETGEPGQQYEVVIRHGAGEHSSIAYDFHPLDVEGWKGDLFPFKLNIRDWSPILSDEVHLPPTVHQFLANDEVMVCHFLPRPAEGRVGAERVPCYHRNADYDEIALFHGGTFLGFELPKGLISHSPQGIHHGAPEMLREHARKTHQEIDRVDWQIIAIDTRRPLRVSDAVRAHDRHDRKD